MDMRMEREVIITKMSSTKPALSRRTPLESLSKVAFLFIASCLIIFQKSSLAQRGMFNEGNNVKVSEYTFPYSSGYLRFSYPEKVNSDLRLRLTINEKSTDYLIHIENGLVEQDLLFNQRGTYHYTLLDANKTIDTGRILITVIDENVFAFDAAEYTDVEIPVEELSPYDNPKSTMFYIASRVAFSDDVNENKIPVSTSDAFKLGDDKLIYVYIENSQPLSTPSLIVDVFLKKGKKENLLETKQLKTDPASEHATLDYTVQQEGKYIFKVYNADETWINNGEVKFNFK